MSALRNPKHERFGPLAPCDRPAGYYVYALADPETGEVFYIGKGKGSRHAHHLREYYRGAVTNAAKFNRIANLVLRGLEPVALLVRDNLTEPQALALERRLIRSIGRQRLTNAIPGTTSQAEKGIVQARDLLGRVMPFDRWVAQRPRSELDMRMYRLVASNLAQTAGLSV